MPVLTDHLALATLQIQGYRRRRVVTAGGDVHILEAQGFGTLPPLVLLHGFSSAGAHFLPLLPRLRARVSRLILPDMPAHGFSDPPAGGVSVGTLKAGLIEALDQVLDRPAVLFGNSMGGVGAVHYALARPERVLGLVLCSPTGAAMSPEELSRFVESLRVDSHAAALSFIDRVTAEPSPLRHLLAWGVRQRFGHPRMRALLASLTPEDLLRPEHLRSLEGPVLLVWGQAERVLPAEHLAFFRRNLPRHARVLEPRGFGHTPFLDDPVGLAEEILGFLGEIEPLQRAGARIPPNPPRAVSTGLGRGADGL